MTRIFKRILARLPEAWQLTLKRSYFHWQLRNGRFHTTEQEYAQLSGFVNSGDWVLDIGANIGHYTARLSDIVGHGGRVIAFEPVPETFNLLVSNVSHLTCSNVTLLNVAASDRFSIVSMEVPKFETGLNNYYQAHISLASHGSLSVLCIPVDQLGISHRITLVKIDAEGHDLSVLNGMQALLQRDHPTLIVEDDSPATNDFLEGIGYIRHKLPGSHNCIYKFYGA